MKAQLKLFIESLADSQGLDGISVKDVLEKVEAASPLRGLSARRRR